MAKNAAVALKTSTQVEVDDLESLVSALKKACEASEYYGDINISIQIRDDEVDIAWDEDVDQ